MKSITLFLSLTLLCRSLNAQMGMTELVSDNERICDTASVLISINRISDINFHDEQYSIGFWCTFIYKDSLLDFKNQLEIVNAKETKIKEIYFNRKNGIFKEKLQVDCIMQKSWNVENYPFDPQDLFLQLHNAAFDTSELKFIVAKDDTNEIFNCDFQDDFGEGWYLSGSDTAIKILPHTQYSTLRFDINLNRNKLGLFIKIFIGMYVAFCVAYMALFIRVKHDEPRFGLPVGALFAAIANKYIVESILPQSPGFTIVDTLHTITFIGILLIVLFSVFSLHLEDISRNIRFIAKTQKMKLLKWIDKNSALIILIFYGSFNIIVIGLYSLLF